MRQLRTEGDPLLRKKSREVEKITDRELELIEDMKETMLKSDGIGLAAVQVGVLKRIIVVDMGEQGGVVELINPEITSKKGQQVVEESCLSVPTKSGKITRPRIINVKGFNKNMEKISLHAEDIVACAFCHEIDHLDGILFIDRAEEIYDLEKGE